ncbi:MAG: DUF362 domain-containing protein [bacterium]
MTRKITSNMTRREFVKGTTCAALGLAAGLPHLTCSETTTDAKSRVVLVRHSQAIDDTGAINGPVVKAMLDDAITSLMQTVDTAEAFKKLVRPDDTVGIKSNEWGPLPTPGVLEQSLTQRVIEAGVSSDRVAVADRGVLDIPVFQRATALINIRPMRTHAWAGVGSLIKNYIMFVENPPDYHDNSCADLAAIWRLPIVKDKTRLNVLVMLTPLFHGVGPHHFDSKFTWPYGGLLVGTDPVAVDAIGLRILQLKRKEHFGEERAMKPVAHHIALADTRHGLGRADMNRIDLVRLGNEQSSLI